MKRNKKLLLCLASAAIMGLNVVNLITPFQRVEAATKTDDVVTKLLTDKGKIYGADWTNEIGESEHRTETIYGTSTENVFSVNDTNPVKLTASNPISNDTGFIIEFDVVDMDAATAKVNLAGYIDKIDGNGSASILISSVGIEPTVGTNYGANGDGQSVWNAVNSTIEKGYRYRYYFRINPDDNSKVDLICYKKLIGAEGNYEEGCVLYKLLDKQSINHYAGITLQGSISIDNFVVRTHNDLTAPQEELGTLIQQELFDRQPSDKSLSNENKYYISGGDIVSKYNETVTTNRQFKVSGAPWPGYRLIACDTVPAGTGYFEEFDVVDMDSNTAKVNLSGLVTNIDQGAVSNIYISSIGIDPGLGTNYGANGDGQSVWNAVNSTIEKGYRYRYYFRINPEDSSKVDLICYKKPIGDTGPFVENCVLYKLVDYTDMPHYGHIYFEGDITIDNYAIKTFSGLTSTGNDDGEIVQETSFNSENAVGMEVGTHKFYANGGELVIAKKPNKGFVIEGAPWPGYRLIACDTVPAGTGYFEEFDVVDMDSSTAKVNLSGLVTNIDQGAVSNIYISSIGIDPGLGTNYGANGDGQSVWNAVNSTIEKGYRYRYYFRINPDDNSKVDLICYKKPIGDTGPFVENCVLYKLVDYTDMPHYGHIYFEGDITIDNYAIKTFSGLTSTGNDDGELVQENTFDSENAVGMEVGAHKFYANGGSIKTISEEDDIVVEKEDLGKIFKVENAPWPGQRIVMQNPVPAGTGYMVEFDILDMDPATTKVNLSGLVTNIDQGAVSNIYISSIGIDPGLGTNYGANGDGQSVWNAVNSTIEKGYRYRYYFRINPDDNSKVDLICYKKPIGDTGPFVENCVLYKLVDYTDMPHLEHIHFEGSIEVDNIAVRAHNGALDGATAEGTLIQEITFDSPSSSSDPVDYMFSTGGSIGKYTYEDPSKEIVIEGDSGVDVRNNGKVYRVDNAPWPGYRIIGCDTIPAGTGYMVEFDLIDMDPATTKVNLSGLVTDVDQGAVSNIYISSIGIDPGIGTNYGSYGDGQSIWNAVNSTIEKGYRYRYYFRINPDDNSKVDLICYKKPIGDTGPFVENCVLYKLVDYTDLPHYAHVYFEGTATVDNFAVRTHNGLTAAEVNDGQLHQETTFDQALNSAIVNGTFFANGGKIVSDSYARFTSLKEDDKLMTYYKIETEKDFDKVLDLNTSIKVDSVNGKAGLALGLADENSIYSSAGVSFIYFENIGKETYVGIIKDGVEGEVRSLGRKLDDFANLHIVGYSNGNLDINIDGQLVVTYENQHLDGYLAILSDGHVGTDISFLPDFTVQVYTLSLGTGTNVATNFNKNYAIENLELDSHNAPSLGSNAKGVEVKDGTLLFNGTSDGTHVAFATGTYADFILQFDWINYKWEDRITNPNGTVNFREKPEEGYGTELYSPLGIAIGKGQTTAGWADTYLLRFFDTLNIVQLIDHGVGYIETMGTGFANKDQITAIRDGKINFYEATVNIAIVSRNNKLYVYGVEMKEGKPDGEHKLLAEFDCALPTGYISISTSEAGYFGIDNLRLTNTDNWTDAQYAAYDYFADIEDDPEQTVEPPIDQPSDSGTEVPSPEQSETVEPSPESSPEVSESPSVQPSEQQSSSSSQSPTKKKGCKGEATGGLVSLITLAGALILRRKRK